MNLVLARGGGCIQDLPMTMRWGWVDRYGGTKEKGCLPETNDAVSRMDDGQERESDASPGFACGAGWLAVSRPEVMLVVNSRT